jgi:hypothetical protein
MQEGWKCRKRDGTVPLAVTNFVLYFREWRNQSQVPNYKQRFCSYLELQGTAFLSALAEDVADKLT